MSDETAASRLRRYVVRTQLPARLFVILARNRPYGVILRRGPGSAVQLIEWDTAADTFTAGQWFRGRVYERR